MLVAGVVCVLLCTVTGNLDFRLVVIVASGVISLWRVGL